ncbi:hypothetical protein [Streptomyces huasconensis]|uniref:hypothetical protein n=1 Tax=Streptomyces huasconensis TaxID=1854574 RepID=UPI0036FDDE6F
MTMDDAYADRRATVGSDSPRRRDTKCFTAMVTAALFLLAGCGTTSDDGAESGKPPAGAPDAVREYVKALNARDREALLAIGAAPDEPWSRARAKRIMRDKGGRGLTITGMPVRYEQMGDYLGKVDLTTASTTGRPLRETVELTHEQGRWHVVLFEWPSSEAKPTSKP